jgi:hypothetical protein
MIGLLFAAWLQGGAPTVGDTIWIERRVVAPPGTEVRAARWVLSGDVELIGRAVVRRESGEVVVRYPAAAWRPGTHLLEVPGPILIGPDGRSDSLPAERRTIEVASVLPAGRDPARLPVQPAARIVPRLVTSPLPVVALLAVAVGLLAVFAWFWRRRGPPLRPVTAAPDEPPPDVASWIEAGELRAVAACAAREIRRVVARLVPAAQPGLDTYRLGVVLAEHRPAWPVAAITATLMELEQTAYGDTAPEDALELFERARDLTESLTRSAG